MKDYEKFALEHKLKLIYSKMIDTKYDEKYILDLNSNGDYLFVFNHLTESMILNRSIIESKEYKVLEKILDYIKFDTSNISLTLFLKLNKFKENLTNKEYREFYEVLLFQIYVQKPKYIILIGEELTKNIFKEYMIDNKIDDEIVMERINNFKVAENIGKEYDFYGVKLISIYDMSSITMLSKSEKKQLVDILVKIKKH